MEVSLQLTEQELTGQLHPNTLKMARHLFDVHGFLKIENLFSKEFIKILSETFLEEIAFDEKQMTLSTQGTEVSHRRYIVPVALKKPFNTPQFYAHPILLTLMREFLGPHCILNSLGAVISLPGATDQHIHADYFPLFEENVSFTGIHPAFAITVAVPLIDIDELNGPTHIWSGSHRTYPIDKKMTSYAKHLLHGPLGSCYFWDYRTIHAGGSNYSDAMRPLLYMAYTRRWFRDTLNPDLLKIDPEEYKKIPPSYHALFRT